MMDYQLLEELDTVQKYISTMFDGLPSIDTTSIIIPNHHEHQGPYSDAESTRTLVEQNIQYGKKIIELSDKFTAKYRKDHFVDRKDIEQKIVHIFRIVCGNQTAATLDEMVTCIIGRLEQQNMHMQSKSSFTPYANINANSRTNSVGYPSVNAIYSHPNKQTRVYYREDEVDPRFQSIGNVAHQVDRDRQDRNTTKSKVVVESLPLNANESEVSQPQKRKMSMSKSKVSKKSTNSKDDNQFTTKNVLQIKGFFEEQQASIRKIFQKFNKIFEALNSTSSASFSKYLKISQQNREYTKCTNEKEKESMKEFVEANVENSVYNLNKMFDLVEILDDHCNRKSKVETYAQGKFKTYIEEINKREQVFSFTVSKLQQNLENLKEVISERNQTYSLDLRTSPRTQTQSPFQIIRNLQEISGKFYDIFPSHSILKDLKVSHSSDEPQLSLPLSENQMSKRGYKNQEVQVSINIPKVQKTTNRESMQTKRTLLELFKLNTRITETIDKFERANKFKKSIEIKQVEKLMDSIKESFPKKTTLSSDVLKQAASYHEQFKKIQQANEKNEKQLTEDYHKKTRKYEKTIQELEKTVEDLIEEHKKQSSVLQANTKKLSKKLEQEKEQNRKVVASKNSLQKSIKQLSSELTRLQKDIKDQYEKYEGAEKTLVVDKINLSQELIRMQQLNKELKQKLEQDSKRTEEEIQTYHSKIMFLETQEETRNEEFCQVKFELEQMVKENTAMKKELHELTENYEEKIKHLDELIESIKYLEGQLNQKQGQVVQLKQINLISQQQNSHLEKQKDKIAKELAKWQSKIKDKQAEADKLREIGALNDADVELLREQMEKVRFAYMEAEEQVEELKIEVSQLRSEKEMHLREIRNLKRQIDSNNERSESQQISRDKLERQLRQLHDENNHRNKELLHTTGEIEDAKRQSVRLRKQINELRENNAKLQGELRNVRQQLQKRVETQSLDSGKRKLELQASKVELRRKSEQLEKVKESYEQKLQVLESKNKQLTQFIAQKQLLTRITNSHLSQ